MRTKIFYISGSVILLLIAVISICAAIDQRSQAQEYKALFYRHMKVFSPGVPDKAEFAGESAPLENCFVREAFEREIMANTFMHSSTIMMFKRANRWFPVIEPILKKNGIPDDFKYLAVAESNLINVVSSAGAEGYWQFIKPTGIKYGLEINDQVDERYNMEKATQAACDFFNDAYHDYKSWTLVAASYNRGIEGVRRAMENQKAGNYYDLYLNDETSRYVFRIMALKEVYTSPVRYGFLLRDGDFYPVIPARLVTVDSAIRDLPSFARENSINYRILKEMNPWIRGYSLTNLHHKTYSFKIPETGALNYNYLMKKPQPNERFFHDTLKISDIQ